MSRQDYRLTTPIARRNAVDAVAVAPEGYQVTIQPPKRSLDQNAKLWAMLTDVSRQVEWHGRWLTQEDWKHVFTAALRGYDVVPNIEGGGFVALGYSTSAMDRKTFAALIELIFAFGAEHGVQWSEPNPYEEKNDD